MRNAGWPLLIFGIFLGVWHTATAAAWVSPILLPSPLETVRYLVEATADGLLIGALLVTLKRLLIGFFIGLIGGLALGFLIYASPLARQTLGLAALGLQTLPSVCWTPLAILWFGQSEAAMYFVVIMGTVWALALAVKNALEATPPIYIRAARVMGASGYHIWTGVILPAALPQMLSGAKLGWAFAWRSLMAAEIYVVIINQFGLGQLLHFGRELNAMDQVLGVMLIIILVGVLADRYVFRPAEKYFQTTRGLA
ncbi:ABC-type nitrate/sulfonate/bicarbonate transport system, permease component [uncultured delta proteobacterium]|uniref:ABC-type nitrate/sulfonate/bicarbonate transport system, permease component n=1 Tax=uncultured delta proteobacterium TaxID=34034 RepID=A0A212JWP6_9DELT|nr:ABC-type nitrate/sulfonate/bicarbonate transport system, permease component [uncultured delta proteobacterium]